LTSTGAQARVLPAALPPAVVIEPRTGWAVPSFAELWQYRELLYFLTWRDIKVRYSQTLLGGAWAIVQPLMLMLVFTFAFRRLAKVETGTLAYPVFALAGLVFWTFFSKAVTAGSDSLITNVQLLTKVYCPRLLIPIATVLSGLVDVCLSLAFFLVFAAAYGYPPSWRLVALPAALLLGLILAIGVSVLLSAVNIRYRDVRQALPFLIMLLLFLSPIAYPITSDLLAVNPLVGIVELWRWSLVGGAGPSALDLGLAITVSLVLLMVGAAYFSRVERVFADVA
jgi:lipopolysaccharide transport system permease protein